MNKLDVIDFFNSLAPKWDAEQIRDEKIINTILDNAGVSRGKIILDVACGTGVLIPDYLQRCACSVTGVDIAENMISIARDKYNFPNVHFICCDVETCDLEEQFDCCMVYNAFPHFPRPENLVKVLARSLKTGGTLSIAHSMSRAELDTHHSNSARKVSVRLMHEDQLAEIFAPYFDVVIKISDEHMYQVVGIKK